MQSCEIPTESLTKTESLLNQLGWSTKPSGADQLAVEQCPFCSNSNFKFYIAIGGEKDGLYSCKVCNASGNYYQLKQRATDSGSLVSLKDVAKPAPGELPDFDRLAHNLACNGDAMDYLVNGRKFHIRVIERMKLGCYHKDGKLWIVIPYFDSAGKPIYYKARTVPPAKKEFDSPAGREAQLYNEAALKPGLNEVLIVEGEPDTLSVLSQGYDSVVGVPGASVKKADWIAKLDKIAPKRIILLYDLDKAGQDGARAMATRIGLDKVLNVVLPEFTLSDGTPGKDVNDWFKAGKTWEELRELVDAAKPFDVAGVQNVVEVLQELEQDLHERGTQPKYLTPWPSLTRKVGGFEDGDLVGIIAEGKVGKTTLAMNLLHYYAVHDGLDCLDFCLEMPPKRSVRKYASMLTQTDDTPGRSKMTPETIRDAVSLASAMSGELFFGYSKDRDAKGVFETIRQAVRRYGIKVVCFDHLHLLCRSLEHQAQEVARLVTDFKALAMELKILLVLIVQPGRVAEGQIVAARNALGSSTIEKLVDYMICLHRNRIAQLSAKDFVGYIETDDNLDPHLLVRVDLARYAPGGCCTLYMDGARSTVRELAQAEVVVTSRLAAGEIPVESNEVPF